MPKIINIQGTSENSDPFYRYKMEEVSIVQEGVKFAFTNIEQICNALNREPKELVSFLQKYFGGQFQLKGSKVLTSKNDLTKSLLQSAIFEFIENAVLCKTCKNPETQKIIEKKKIFLECGACGAKNSF